MTAQDWVSVDPAADGVSTTDLLRNALHQSVEPWALLQALRDGDGTVADFVFRDINRAAATYRGLLPEQALGHPVVATMPDVVGSGLFDLLVNCVDSGEALVLDDFAYRARPVDGLVGRRFRFEIRAVRVGADHLSVTWRDVDARYLSARRLAESEERYRLLAENSGDVVVHVRDEVIVWVSPSVTDSFGAPPSFWLGRPIGTSVVAEDLPAFTEMVNQTETGDSVVRRVRLLDAGGHVHWTEIHAKIFYDAAGNPDGRTASLRIIDDEVAAEQTLELARGERAHADARYRTLIEKSAVATSLHTPDGRFATANQAMCDFFGYDADTLLTMTWQELTPTESLDEDLAADADIMAGRRESYRTTKQYYHADGHLIWGDLSLSCMRTPDDEVDHMICQIVDITAEMQAREQLIISEERSRALAQDLQGELNSAAHYLRSALPDDLAGPVETQSRYLPSQTLGGDFFDAFWVDDDHLIVYLLDVSGHGVQSALVAVSAYNLLRSSTVSTSTLLHPSQMLGTLNRHFAMERHDSNYVTIWYGVYQKSTRTMRYASGGHPPAVLFTGETAVELPSQSPPAGMFEDTTFPVSIVPIPSGSQLLLYSDGVYELTQPDGEPWSYTQFMRVCSRLARSPQWSLDDLIADVLSHSASGTFEDDCSLVRLTFG